MQENAQKILAVESSRFVCHFVLERLERYHVQRRLWWLSSSGPPTILFI